MKCTIVVLLVVLVNALTTSAAPSPGFVYAAHPAPSSDTQIVRDVLGNQATSYAYQDGHSSSVAVSRNDVSKHLVAVPAPAPVVYTTAFHAAPAPLAYHAAAPAYHQAYHHAIPTAYHHGFGAYHPYAAAAGPAYYY